MALMQTLDPFYDSDEGVELDLTLTFNEFDPTGGVAQLHAVRFPNAPGDSDNAETPRDMTLVGDVATYVTTVNDYLPGRYIAQVRVTKGGLAFNSEMFRMVVLASI